MGTKFLRKGEDILEKKGTFELVGRNEELNSLMKVLMRKNAHSAILVGKQGVGISAITLGLELAKTKECTPFDIKHKRIYFLDTDGLFSDIDEIHENFKKMVSVLSETPDTDTILVVEDARDFIEGISNSGNPSFINTLMREVEAGTFQIVFETKDDDLGVVLNCHSHMKELFTIIEVKEPERDNLMTIVQEASHQLFTHHKIAISQEAIKTAIELTSKYPSKEKSLARAQPQASLTLLDRALATFRKNVHVQHPEVQKALKMKNEDPTEANDRIYLETVSRWSELAKKMENNCHTMTRAEKQLSAIDNKLAVIEKEREERANKPEQGITIQGSSQMEESLYTERAKIQTALDQCTKDYSSLLEIFNKGLILSEDDVLSEFAQLSGISFSKLNENHSEKFLNLACDLKKVLLGQDHVVDQVADALLISQVGGLKERGKPDAAFMFCGSSGVGKTELAKQLAKLLKDDEGALLRFDMSEYKEKFAVTSLIGAPAGFAGYEAGGTLTNAVRKNPNSIILFDEIEKADPSIFDIFLQVLDDARLTDTQGRVVSFENTTLIFTTNTGAANFLDSSLSYEEMMENTMTSLNETYRAEFLNRFNGRENIVGFKALPIEVIEMIAKNQIESLNRDLQDNGVDLSVVMADDDIKRLVKAQYREERGARGIVGVFRTSVYPQFARLIIQNEVDGQTAHIQFKDGQISVTM